MKKTLRNLVTLATLILLVLPNFGCGSKPTATPSTDPAAKPATVAEVPKDGKVFAIGTGDVGGTFYPVGAALAKVINDKMPGYKVTVQSTGGSVDNSRMVGTGELVFGMAMGDVAFDALKGQGKFKAPLPKVTALFATYSSISQWIALDSNKANTMADLKGKKVSVGMPGSGSEVASAMILKAAGLKYPEDIIPQYIGVAEGCEAVRDGFADVTHAMGGVPFGGFLDLAETKNTKMIPVDKAIIEKIKATAPYYYLTQIPANSYKGQKEAVDTLGVKCLFLMNGDLSEDLAYTITKTIWENAESLRANNASLKEMTDTFVTSDLPVPLHPGAVKFWKEKGLLK